MSIVEKAAQRLQREKGREQPTNRTSNTEQAAETGERRPTAVERSVSRKTPEPRRAEHAGEPAAGGAVTLDWASLRRSGVVPPKSMSAQLGREFQRIKRPILAALNPNDGTALPNGQVGEVCARGGNIMQGYWKRAEQTAATLRDGWLRTGDLGYMDDDGFVFIVDRAKDMIISGGENVFSVEVEGAIYQHPDVQETAVIGVPSERWGEAVHAVVVPKAGATPTEQAIIEHCRGVIADYKLPRSVEIRSEPLPVSGAGKILKTTLRDDWGTRNGA